MVSDTLDELRAVKLTLAEQADELSNAQRASREALAAVEASRQEALAAQRAQAKLLDKVEGEIAELVAAEEKRKAEEEAAKNRPPAPMFDDRGRINLNVASREQLLAIPEIGLAYADKIIQNRPISSLEDLVKRGLMPAEQVRKAGLRVFAQ